MVGSIFKAPCVNAIHILDDLIKSALSAKGDAWPELLISLKTSPPVQEHWNLTKCLGLRFWLWIFLSMSSTHNTALLATLWVIRRWPACPWEPPLSLDPRFQWILSFLPCENWTCTLSMVWHHHLAALIRTFGSFRLNWGGRGLDLVEHLGE